MAELDTALEIHVDQAAAISLDARWMPLLIVTWFGSPSGALFDHVQAWLDRCYVRARERGTPIVIIADGSEGKVPSAKVRRQVVGIRHDPELLLQVIAVVAPASPMLRGMVAAISWIVSDQRQRLIVGSYADALNHAADTLESAGLSMSPDVPAKSLTWGELGRR